MLGVPVVIAKTNRFAMARTEHTTNHLPWDLALKRINLPFYALVSKQVILRIVMVVITSRL